MVNELLDDAQREMIERHVNSFMDALELDAGVNAQGIQMNSEPFINVEEEVENAVRTAFSTPQAIAAFEKYERLIDMTRIDAAIDKSRAASPHASARRSENTGSRQR
jgi:hypothetical protein